MAGPVVTQALQLQAGAPGTAAIGPNLRVRGQLGLLGTQLDTLTFSNGAVGAWVVPNLRTRVQGAFVVSQSSQGIAQPPGPPAPTPIVATTGDARIRSL